MTEAPKVHNRVKIGTTEYEIDFSRRNKGEAAPKEKVPKKLPPALTSIAHEMRDGMLLEKLPEGTCEKNLVEAFVKDLNRLRSYCTDCNHLFSAIFATNIEVRTDSKLADRVQEFAKAKYAELKPAIPTIPAPKTDLLQWEIMAQDAAEIHRQFKEEIKNKISRFLWSVAKVLDALLAARVVGLLQQQPNKPSVMLYTFFRWVVNAEQTAARAVNSVGYGEWRRTKRTTSGWTEEREERHILTHEQDIGVRHLNAEHEHQLYDAELSPWNVNIRKPKWLDSFLCHIPPWLKAHIQIAHGSMLKERVIERETRVQNWTEKTDEEVVVTKATRSGLLWSPGVCLDHWVLTGWSDRDLEGKS